MKIDIISLFPEMFDGPFGHSIIKRAKDAGLLDVCVTNPREFALDKHKIVDDTPFGGGSGMVMKPDPLYFAVEQCKKSVDIRKRRILLTSPSGSIFTQQKAKEFAMYEQLIILCGHYEGIDDRIREHVIDESISIGDYVLTGGELPAMVVVDAVARMIPGVLGAEDAAQHDSFFNGLLEYPQYTRPREFRGWQVPEVLLSGDHAKIARWRRKQSLKITLEQRPDLLQQMELSKEDAIIMKEILAESQLTP